MTSKQTSKQKQNSESQILLETYSPLEDTMPQCKPGNLTGSARKLKDGAADLHSLLQKYQSLTVDGSNIIQEISNIKLEKILSKDETRHPLDLLPETLLLLCDKLETLMPEMEKIVGRLMGLVEMSKGVVQLEHYSQKSDKAIVLFQTWDVSRFESVFQEIAEMYQKDLQLKQCIKENICHTNDRNNIMFYLACWIHQPSLENNMELLLESMLVETRLKAC